MADEASISLELEPAVNMTCADGTGIEQGAICKLADPLTASLSDGDEDDIAGIVKTEKVADDGTLSVALYRRGWFVVTLSGNGTTGQAVSSHSLSGGSNIVATSTATAVGSKTLGLLLQDGTDGDRVLMELKPGCNNTAYT